MACAVHKRIQAAAPRAGLGLFWHQLILVVALLAGVACHHERPERLPGETDILVTAVNIQGAGGAELQLPYSELFILLGLRKGNVLVTHRYFNEFRLAEDRRRLVSWWQSFGYFDAEVSEPKLEWSPDKKSVAVTWTVTEGAEYHIGSITLKHVPAEHESAIRALVPYEVGDSIDLEEYRLTRLRMAEHLQRAGYGHAKVISRTYVDKQKKLLHWYYFADPGPKTVIGKVVVEGAHRLPEDSAIWRAGLVAGEPYSLALKEKAQLDLVDSGSYASASIKPDADVDRVLPGDRPDTGGDLKDVQVDQQGNLVPRQLPETVNMRLVVVEAPRTQLRLRAGAEADPSRGDAYFGARLWLRDLFGPFHHIVVDGRIGYGVSWDDDDDELSGPYGEALVRYIKSGLFGRLGDFRLSGRYRDLLYPGFQLREIAAGPGVRSTLAPGLFVEFDTLFRYEDTRAFGGFAPAVEDDFDLTDDETKLGELDAAVIWGQAQRPRRGDERSPAAAVHGPVARGRPRHGALPPPRPGASWLRRSQRQLVPWCAAERQLGISRRRRHPHRSAYLRRRCFWSPGLRALALVSRSALRSRRHLWHRVRRRQELAGVELGVALSAVSKAFRARRLRRPGWCGQGRESPRRRSGCRGWPRAAPAPLVPAHQLGLLRSPA